MSSKSSTSEKKFFQNPLAAMHGKVKRGTEVLSAAVRKVQTRRPFTPSDSNRGSLSNIYCQTGRPTSGMLSGSVDSAERRPFSAARSRRSSGFKERGGEQTEALKLEPIITATRPSVKGSRGDPGPHSLPSSLPPIMVSGSRLSYVIAEAKSKDRSSIFTLSSNDESKSVPGYLIRSESQSSDIFIPVDSCELFACGDKADKSVESPNVSVKLTNLLPQLEKLCNSDAETSENSCLKAVSDLYQILDDSCILGTSFEHRHTFLKLLFRLIDFNLPRLTLTVAKTILGIKVSGKNLMHLCKAIYKISMDSRNDVEFLQCQILEPFLKTVRVMDALVDTEALLYCMATMKFLSANEQILVDFYNSECPTIVLHHLSDIVHLIESQNEKKEFIKILAQLITAMRNMAENEIIRETFVNNGTLSELLLAIEICSTEVQVVLPAVRVLSKIVEESKGCEAVKTCEDIFSTFTILFKNHSFHLDIVVRLGYIVGSLVSADCDTAMRFYSEPGFLNLLHTTLCDYVQMDLKRKEMGLKTIVYKEKLFDFTVAQWDHDVPDVIVKMVRIMANMCLNSDVGQKMALDKNCIMCFVQIIEAYRVVDVMEEASWVPFLSALIALNNITYFVYATSEMSSCFTRLVKSVLPLLNDAYDLQVRLEACHIVGNLTRSSEIRSFILQSKMMPSLVSLLEENDRELLYVAYGVMMNVLIDNSVRIAFYEANGIIRLLHQLHLSLSRDWKMVSLLCQILWNYCGGSETSHIPLSNIEVQHLIKVLSYSIKSETVPPEDEVYDIWNNHFSPVASQLLQLLKEKPCMSP